MKTKLNELLEFPTLLLLQVMGLAKPELVDQVVEVVQRHAPGDYSPSVKPSSKGNHHSVSITINCDTYEQVEDTVTKNSAISKLFVWCCNPSSLPGLPGTPPSPL